MIGTQRKPTKGRRADGSGPGGLFGAVAVEVFTALDVKVKDVFIPCKAAIGKLKPERLTKLRAPINFREPSMFDVAKTLVE